MTVQLTPRSPDSKGLAYINSSSSGFEIVELYQGKGTYLVDWEVKAVRKGHIDFKVVEDIEKVRAAMEENSSQNLNE